MKRKIKCRYCKKDAVVIEKKIYHCPDCYIDKYNINRVRQGPRFESSNYSSKIVNES